MSLFIYYCGEGSISILLVFELLKIRIEIFVIILNLIFLENLKLFYWYINKRIVLFLILNEEF